MRDSAEPKGKGSTASRRTGLLLVVSAPSGAGKTTLCREMAHTMPGLQYSISYTTRLPRPNEVDGKDYFFIGEPEFMQMVQRNEFAEWAKVHNHFYGTHAGFLKRTMAAGTDVLLDVDVQGAKLLKKRFPDGIFIFVLPPSMATLMERLRERRSDPPEEIERRLQVARKEIQNFIDYDYIIVNDDIKKAIRDLESVILAERIRINHADPDWIRGQFLN
ncbi:MAG TPA: guanylate kinase [Nitrospiria bacterium]|nr:guanylate kinase [Nitrospiria bacterium]